MHSSISKDNYSTKAIIYALLLLLGQKMRKKIFENIRLEIGKIKNSKMHYLSKSKRVNFPIRLQTQY